MNEKWLDATEERLETNGRQEDEYNLTYGTPTWERVSAGFADVEPEIECLAAKSA
jgi:hypothetical protein